ncbi:MAG: ABC transporter permease [Candidatus Eisenbacteria sp.]|nr:ABC transporter permease [Candidatus Eisenbacteria bacterium]
MGCEALQANRLRSALTILGTVVGVVAVVSVVSITQGLNRYVSQEILSMGSHIFSLDKYGFITSNEEYFEAARRKDLRSDDARYLQDHLTMAAAVVPTAHYTVDVLWEGRQAKDVALVGIGSGYAALGDEFDIACGRHLTYQEEATRRRSAVIGSDIAEELFGAVDAIGQRMRVGRESFWVVGVLKQRGAVLGTSRDNVVLMPITTFESIYGSRRSISIIIKAASPAVYEACQEEAMLLLKLRRGRQPWEPPDFGVQNSETYYAFYSRATSLFYLGMIAVVGLSVVVGGIVMMNIMLVAVTERTKEIGIRMAVGARRRDIMMQFLIEALALSSSGGILGVLLGALIAVLVNVLSPLPARVEFWSVFVGLCMAVGIGVVAGVYPAMRASRLAPVVALGYEK